MAVRFSALALGGQPAVVKVASFGGGRRLKAMLNYISRHGAIGVENEQGQAVRGSSQLATLAGEWGSVLKNRSASRDIATFELSIQTAEGSKQEWVQRLLKQALGDRSFAFGFIESPTGQGSIRGVTVLRSKSGERLTGDKKAADIIQRRLSEVRPADAAVFRFIGYGNGTDYGSRHLQTLVQRHQGKVWNEDGRLIGDVATARLLVQREWRGQLHSRKSRDVMHLVLSARAGTDAIAFERAGRAFLAAQFPGHRYASCLHDPSSDPKEELSGGRRPHVHLHAIVSLRSDSGDRITTTISVFRQWRILMADKARAHGIEMEMTDRRERASAAAYSRRSVRPVQTNGRTRHVGNSEAAELRYNNKRNDRVGAVSARQSMEYRFAALRAWQRIEPQLVGDGRRWVQEQVGRLMRSDPSDRGFDARRRDPGLWRTPGSSDCANRGAADRAVRPEGRARLGSVADAAREHLELRRELNDLLEYRRILSDERDARGAGEGKRDLRPSLARQEKSARQPLKGKALKKAPERPAAAARPLQDNQMFPQRDGHRGGDGSKVDQDREAGRSAPVSRHESWRDNRDDRDR
ncbi:MAG: hypothetical protein ACK4N1_05660 [Pseudorhizobium sp.]